MWIKVCNSHSKSMNEVQKKAEQNLRMIFGRWIEYSETNLAISCSCDKTTATRCAGVIFLII